MIVVKLSDKENIAFDFEKRRFIYTSAHEQEKGIPPILVSQNLINTDKDKLTQSTNLTKEINLLRAYWMNKSMDEKNSILYFNRNKLKATY